MSREFYWGPTLCDERRYAYYARKQYKKRKRKKRRNNMSAELKPCPFCNYPGYIDGDGSGYSPSCSNIKCPVLNDDGWTKEASIRVWNTRPIEDALKAELARKDKEIEALDKLVEAYYNYEHTDSDTSYHITINKLNIARMRLTEIRKEQ